MLQRQIKGDIDRYLKGNDKKIFFLWGPRRSGKTTLLRKISQETGERVFNFDFLSDRELFVPEKHVLGQLVKEHKIILIDEVQTYPESTIALKLLHDEFNIKIIATGSSELRKKTQAFDSLAGRFTEYFCLPINSFEAWGNVGIKDYEQKQWLVNFTKRSQIYGLYPEVYDSDISDEVRIDLLTNIVETYILKDIVDIYNLKNIKLAKDILTKIALQLGSEVSLREIASSLNTNVATVSNYVEIFSKNYVLLPLPAFKTNARRAISKNTKYYFFDLGIRNSLIRDFRPMDLRQDRGGIFENFIFSEIMKLKLIERKHLSFYFYREYEGKEVDLVIEDYQKKYICFEIKSKEVKVKSIFPLPHDLRVVTPLNFYSEIGKLNNR